MIFDRLVKMHIAFVYIFITLISINIILNGVQLSQNDRHPAVAKSAEVYIELETYAPDYTKFDDTKSSSVFAGYYNEPVLDDPSEYYVTILQLSVPLSGIPVFVPDIYDPIYANNTVYKVGIKYNGTMYSQQVVWEPETAASATAATYYCQDVHHMIGLINKAFEWTLRQLPRNATNLPISAPRFTMDNEGRISINTYISARVLIYDVYINQPLSDLLPGLDKFVHKLNSYEPAIQITTSSQIRPALAVWSPVSKIQLYNIDFIEEFIVSDPTATNFIFAGQSELLPLYDTEPLTAIRINVNWIDKHGRYHPIIVPYDQVMTLRLGFIKK